MTPSGFYVYELADPVDGVAFYVGKGSGERAWRHEYEVRLGRGQNVEKCRRIKAILDAGREVLVRIVREGMEEDAAYALERDLISAGRDYLTNVADGGRGAVDVDAERVLLETAVYLTRALDKALNGRMLENFTPAQLALARLAKEAVLAWEKLAGKSLAPEGFEIEWAV